MRYLDALMARHGYAGDFDRLVADAAAAGRCEAGLDPSAPLSDHRLCGQLIGWLKDCGE